MTNKSADPFYWMRVILAAEEGAVLLQALVNLDDLGAGKELHHHARRNNGGDAELHERAAVRGEDHPHPVERVGGLVRHDAIEGDLAADEEDKQGDGGPQDLLAEGDLALRGAHLGKHAHARPHEVQDAEVLWQE